MDQARLWWRDGAIYQIYPRSFADSNHDDIGDLNGIIAHLDYLVELGIDAIWLSPIYPSPEVDFGYDISDYNAIDPRFGSMDDFERLLKTAHQKGIKIILDLVLNHTSDQHPWFLSSRRARQDPFHDWYIWRDAGPGGKPPNNWQSVFGGSAWEYDSELKQYYYHMFYKEQPDVNWRNPSVRKAMLDVFRFWLERGVDGFRLDVFNLYFKHPDLLDNPIKSGLRGFDRQKHINDVDQPEMIPLLQEIRQLLDSYPEKYAVGETFGSSAERAAYYCNQGLLHAAFDFEMLACRWNPGQFYRAIQNWENALLPGSWPNWVMNNHDTKRSASRLTWDENDERLKIAATILLTQRGTPFLYYGEEIGMRDIRLTRNQIKDPIGKRYWPLFKGRDGCRSPMQWDDSAYAGFSRSEPWLPVHPDYQQRNVKVQMASQNSLYHFYRKLLHLRQEYPALREGMFIPLTYDPRWILAYLRQIDAQTILVALNFSRRPLKLFLGTRLAKGPWQLLLSNKRDTPPSPGSGSISLEPVEACILLLE
jgi:alpha-glucosidase